MVLRGVSVETVFIIIDDDDEDDDDDNDDDDVDHFIRTTTTTLLYTQKKEEDSKKKNNVIIVGIHLFGNQNRIFDLETQFYKRIWKKISVVETYILKHESVFSYMSFVQWTFFSPE